MARIDLRKSLNAISDVVTNRPPPLRKFDQIYMKSADMLMHVDHLSTRFKGRSVIFVGDGDAIALSLIHLHALGMTETGPERVHVIDFDQRMVDSIQTFAKKYAIADRVTAELYNVANPLPPALISKFDAFHINPPFGQHNAGNSIKWFLRRAFSATSNDAVGCIVIADDTDHPWTADILQEVQGYVLKEGWIVKEMRPEFHGYHLEDDDASSLKSCSLIIQRNGKIIASENEAISEEEKIDFYGVGKTLIYEYVKPLSTDNFELIPFK